MKKALYLPFVILLILVCFFNTFAAETQAYPFGDIKTGDWYENAALHCFKYGYVKGTANGIFSPDTKMSRAMAVQLLCSMTEMSKEELQNPFTDVRENAWYYEAVCHAYSLGITEGTGNSRFSPDRSITRKEFITLAYKYALHSNHPHESEPIDFDITLYTDNASIPEYALDAFDWSLRYGIIQGFTDKTLRPDALISRAEAVQIIYGYDTQLGHSFEELSYTPRSCTTEGAAVYICNICNYEKSVKTNAYHVYDNGRVTVEPLCGLSGEKTYYCINCADSCIRPVAPTEKHAWDKGIQLREPTCINNGIRTYTCTVCQKTKNENIQPTGEHIYGTWTVSTRATPTKTGVKSRYCAYCNSSVERIYRDSSYYQIEDSVKIPSGGYNVSVENIGIKVIYINKKMLGTTSASYTQETRKAVMNFQKNNGLAMTGAVDVSTWMMMGYSYDEWYSLASYVTPKKVNVFSNREEYIEAMIAVAKEYADKKTVYRIGASGTPGTYADCSGLIYQCLYAVGINPDTNIIDHGLAIYEYTSYYLAKDPKLGLSVSLNDMQRGDLIFYANQGDTKVCHVALYAGDGMIYDAWPNIGTTYRSVNIKGCHAVKAIRLFP